MRDLMVKAGDGDLAVTLRVADTEGQGLSAFLYGGTLPHVGGSALASPGACVRGVALSSCDLWVQTVPGHKDSDVAKSCARKLCLASGQPVCVCAGVNVENATVEQVRALTSNCEAATDKMVALLMAGGE